jgi:hypothetical protein
MYPYFQKNRKPNPSNSSKLSVREASPADPLRQFLAENPAFGTLLFQVTGGQGAVPIERATVVISKALPNGHTLSVTTMTNESGKTAEFHCLRRAAINRRHRAAQMFLRHTTH